MNSIAEQKQLIRNQVRKKRNNLTFDLVNFSSQKLCQNLLPICQDKPNIAIYHADNNEIFLSPLIEQLLHNNHNIFRPIAYKSSRQMQFVQIYDSNNYPIFVDENYKADTIVECYNLDLIIMPLLAIDQQGFRLGQGGGYYDSTLANTDTKLLKCGVGYDWQLIDYIPHDNFDVSLDLFVSDKQIIYFK